MNTEQKEKDETILFGRNVVLEGLKNDSVQINKLLISNSFSDTKTKNEIILLAKERKIPFSIVPEKKLDITVTSKHHQGVIASISPIKYLTVKDIITKTSALNIILVAHEIEDNHNLGAMIRTFVAGNGTKIILTGKKNVSINPTTIKTSAGTLFQALFARAVNCINVLNELKKNAYWIIGTDNSSNAQPIYKNNLPDKIAIVVGNEHEGLGQLIKKNCDFLVKVPIIQTVNSLNVSVAFGITFFEILRQKNNL